MQNTIDFAVTLNSNMYTLNDSVVAAILVFSERSTINLDQMYSSRYLHKPCSYDKLGMNHVNFFWAKFGLFFKYHTAVYHTRIFQY